MKIIIPIDQENGPNLKLANHFGRCKSFILLDEKGDILKTIENFSTHTGGTKQPPQLIKEFGADILICKNLGMKAITMLDNFNIKVYLTNKGTIKESFDLFEENKLKQASEQNCCKNHGFNH